MKDSKGGENREINSWLESLSMQLADLENRSLLRELKVYSSLIDFASNDYLSLNSSGILDRIQKEAFQHYQSTVGSTGSRLVTGHRLEFEKSEILHAQWTGRESSLLFQSGYSANTGTIPAILKPRDVAICDRMSHASILDGIRLSGASKLFFRHNDLEDLEKNLNTVRKREKRVGRIWIFTESVFSMDGDSPDLSAFVALAKKWDALIYLDEAHAVGILGKKGEGLLSDSSLSDGVAVAVYPMGKAPGYSGAFVTGSSLLKRTLIQRARSFIYSTAQPPFLALTLQKIIEYLQTPEAEIPRRKLNENIVFFHNLLGKKYGLNITGNSHIVPVHLGKPEEALRLSGLCRKAGYDVRAFRPPTVPPGTSRIRVNLQSAHTREQLEGIADLIGTNLHVQKEDDYIGRDDPFSIS